MAFCSNCGKEFETDAKYCSGCGVALDVANKNEKEQRKTKPSGSTTDNFSLVNHSPFS